MNKIELYDIITFKNNKRYTMVSEITKNNKTYAMLVEIDEEENPIPENVKIVEFLNNNSSIKEVKDESILKLITLELSKKTVEELDK